MPGDEARQAKEQQLKRCVAAGHWDRAVAVASDLLAKDPDDSYCHQMLALASLNLKNFKTAGIHIKAALAGDPEDSFSHYLQARHLENANRLFHAKEAHLRAIRFDSQNADYWIGFGWNCCRRGDFKSGLEAGLNARSLNPQSAEVENLIAAARSGLDQDGTEGNTAAQIAEWEQALRFDPDNSAIHHNIGQVYLREKNDPGQAEEHFRRALLIDPIDKDYREALFQAIKGKSRIQKFLMWPWRFLNACGQKFERNLRTHWWIGLLFPLGLALFGFWAIFMFPAAKIHEYVTLADLRSSTVGKPKLDPGKIRLRSWPVSLRFGFFLALYLAFLAGVLTALSNPGIKQNLGNILGGLLIVFIIAGVWISARMPGDAE